MEQVLVSGVTGDRNQAKVTVVGVPDHPGIAATLFCSIADAAINVDMIIQNVSQDSDGYFLYRAEPIFLEV